MKERKKMVVGNWKMNTTISESIDLAVDIKNKIKEIEDIEVVICPPFVSLNSISLNLGGSFLRLGAQNCFWEPEGAYTGEISPKMLQDICHYVILGHSERRQYFGETNIQVGKKVKTALEFDLIPIICLGESKTQRARGQTKKIVLGQLRGALNFLDRGEVGKVVLAYEPIWAVGARNPDEPGEITKVTALIREEIKNNYGKNVVRYVRILYGGSVEPKNVAILTQTGVDGFLIGRASLDAQRFVKIIQVLEDLYVSARN